MLTQRQGTAATVLGGGIAGLFAAGRLADEGYRVTLIDSAQSCGGTHRSCNIGPYTFDVGSIFYEDQALIFQMAEHLREQCPQVVRQQRRIARNGSLLHYPITPREAFSTSPWQLPASAANLLFSRLFAKRDGTLAGILRSRIGERFLTRTGLRDYIHRFNHLPAEQLDEEFFFKRMGFIDQLTQTNALMKFALKTVTPRKGQGIAAPPRPLRVRPFEGFARLFDPIIAGLQAKGVQFRLGEAIKAIDRTADGNFRITTDKGKYPCASCISTIPLDSLYRMLFNEPSGLTSLDMTTLFVSAASFRKASGNVFFNFSSQGRWKRVTFYSRLYPDAPTDREFFNVEVTLAPGAPHDPEAAFADFAQHMMANNLAEDLKLEGSDLVREAYPLYLPGTDDRIAQVIARITAAGIILAGRQGRFEYLPTSTGVIRQVGKVLDSMTAPAPLASVTPTS